MLVGRAAQIAQALEHGALVNTGRTIGGADNVNGVQHVVRAQTSAGPVEAIVKPPSAQPLQEVGAARAGAMFGIGHLFPATVRRGDTTLIEMVAGSPGGKVGVRDVATLDAALGAAHLAQGTAPSRVASAAQRDRELLGTFDYVLANDDRHPANLMVAPSRVTAIDQGSIGNGEMEDALVPRLGPWFQGGPDAPGGRVELGDEARTAIRAVDPDALAAELDTFAAAPASMRSADKLLPGVGTGEYRERVLERLEHVQRTGAYDWVSARDTPPPDPRVLARAAGA